MRLVRNWKQLWITLVIGFVPTAICYTMRWWWPGTIFALLTLFAMFFALARKLYVIAFTVYAGIVIAVVSGSLIEGWIPREWGIDSGWRITISGIAGLLLGIIVPIIVWYPIMYVSTVWVMDLSNSLGIPWRTAMRFVTVRVLQTGQHVISVDDGKVAFDNTGGLLQGFGGPGLLIVGLGHAAVLQNAGKITQIVGPGMHRLAQFENLLQPKETKGIVDLRPQLVTTEVEDVRTKDGISLTFQVGIAYQIEPTYVTDRRPESHFAGGDATTDIIGAPEYPVYKAIIRKCVFQVPREGWKTGWFPGEPTHILRDVVATHTLDEIFSFNRYNERFAPDQRIVREIETQVNARFNPVNEGVWFRSFDIRQIEMPADVEERVREKWTARIGNELKIEQARAESQAIIEVSEGRAQALERLEEVKLRARRGNAALIEDLSQRLNAINNRSISESFIRVVQELTNRIGQDETIAIRYIEAMEAIVGSEGPKEVVLTTQAPAPPTLSRQI